MSDKYILDGRTPKPTDNILEWGKAFETGDRLIAWDQIGYSEVSTVFLGLDHSFGEGPPLLFETMVFGGALDQEQVRYSTYDEAEAGHKAMCKRVRAHD